MDIRIKRIYDEPKKNDGYRVLVDRLWPPGVSRERAGVDQWCKSVAPSPELRKWFAEHPRRWAEFKRRYASELRQHEDDLSELTDLARNKRRLTLLVAARDTEHNQAVALKEMIERSP